MYKNKNKNKNQKCCIVATFGLPQLNASRHSTSTSLHSSLLLFSLLPLSSPRPTRPLARPPFPQAPLPLPSSFILPHAPKSKIKNSKEKKGELFFYNFFFIYIYIYIFSSFPWDRPQPPFLLLVFGQPPPPPPTPHAPFLTPMMKERTR